VVTRLLTDSEFKSLLAGAGKVENITGKEAVLSPGGVIDIAPYVRAVPAADLDGYTTHEELLVEVVYRTSNGPFDFVHVMTKRKNVYLVVVVDVTRNRIHGHRLLDLNAEYGFDAANDA
jgi:hypothetical protein